MTRDLHCFLGFANFYRRFIRGFSSVASPLTLLLKGKPKKLEWNQEASVVFETLKQIFTTAPILWRPDSHLQFLIRWTLLRWTSGVEAILSQHQGNPAKLFLCAFYTRKLMPAERNYDLGNWELLAIKAALEEWWQGAKGAKGCKVPLCHHHWSQDPWVYQVCLETGPASCQMDCFLHFFLLQYASSEML